MSEVRHDLSDAAMEAAVEANLLAMFALGRKWPRMEVHDDPEMLWTITDIPFTMFNMVLRARLAPDRIEDAVEATIARGRARNVPIGWWIGRTTRPLDLGTLLEEHRFAGGGGPPGMAMDLRSLAADVYLPPGLVIERVDEPETLREWCRLMVAGFEWPEFVQEAFFDWYSCLGLGPESPLLHYIGRLDGGAVSTSTLLLADGVAGIYDITTVPEVRGQGIGTALTYIALREARSRGYRVSALQASKMGYGIYQKLGFREYCTIRTYTWRPDKSGPAG
jgi:GNAT superfamily N-acetyltransferase